MTKRIIFFGTPQFAVNSLKKIVEEGFNIVAVVTVPDRPAGRGRQIRTSAVKDFARTLGMKTLQPTNLKDQEFTKQLFELKPDLMIVVAFRMLPKSIWSIPAHGTFNLHASLLPEYRGAAPINWVIINQEKFTGVTTFLINDKIDAGAILLQEKVQIEENDTAGSLHDKLSVKGSELICKTIKGIFESTITPKKQESKGEKKLAPKLNKKNIFIQWDQPLEVINAKIKGLSPYPGAKSNWIENQKVMVIKIFDAEIFKEKHNFIKNKVIIKDKKILIAHPDGFINCRILQLPNKKRMSAIDLLNGISFSNKLEVS